MIGFTGVVDPYTKQGLQLQVKGGNAGDYLRVDANDHPN